MNNIQQVQQLETSLLIKQKLPLPIPLLPRAHLKSQLPKTILKFVENPKQNTKLTQSQQLYVNNKKSQEIQIPFNRLEDFLDNREKICYNIIGIQQYSFQQQTFGFQYCSKQKKVFQPKFIKNTATFEADLEFQSRFESGNLLFAYENNINHYILIIRPDYNTMSFCQWFYFKVKNRTNINKKIKFSIINMTKSSSLFNQGMKILTLNKKSDRWIREGQQISYKRNNIKRKPYGYYFTLSWETNINSYQQIYYAYSQPYTYSSLNNRLDQLQHSRYVKRSILCRTLLNNRVDLITISSGSLQSKKVIIILSRTHPVESVSSFVMNGIINFLISEEEQAKYLRQKFVFKLVPMVNPDGVIHGNSRCSMKGVDLNRCWNKPAKTDFEIYNIKRLIVSNAKADRLLMFCDLHGHSKKKNIFIYGCHDYAQPYASRQLPYIISRLFEPFSYKDCNFVVQKLKVGTARVSLWKKLKIPNIFTLQSSFCSGQNSLKHLDEKGYIQMGKNLCKAINIYYSNKLLTVKPTKNGKIEKEKIKENKKLIQEQIQKQDPKQQYIQIRKNLLEDLHSDPNLLEYGFSTPSYSQSEQEKEQIYQNIQRNYTQKKQISQTKSLSKLKQTINYNLSIEVEVKTERQGKPYLMNQNKKSEKLLRKKHGETSYQKQKISFANFVHSNSKDLSLTKRIQNKLQRGYLHNIFKQKTENSFRCVTQNFPIQKNYPLLSKQMKKKFEHSQKSNEISQKINLQKYVPQIKTFDFEQQFKKTTLDAQIRNKYKRQAEKQMYSQIYDLVSRGVKKQTLMQFIQKKLQSQQLPKPAQILNSNFLNFRKKNVNSRLETMLKKINT